LFVTLEPCCHQGKTPPCTDALIRAGVARVVAALPDPFPLVASRGITQLQAAGIAVEIGLCDAEARRQNAPYLKLVGAGRPYVHAKWAMTLDGKIATRTGDSKWISNETSRLKVHELRGRVDGILVGIGTALMDDPLLTARPSGARVACRVVLDSKARLPLTAQLVRTARTTPTMIVVSQSAPGDRVDALQAAGCEAVILSLEHEGSPRVITLLDELGKRRWTNLLVEGGSEVLGRFLDAGAIDEVHVFVSPRLVGGAQGKTPVAGRGVESLAEAWNLSAWHTETLDGDVYLRGWK
jgi:diaminohydroxyphosphoribosylaminopyrimidine deaminase/5-amino-6-(5-phosphoribosylamino)uracil reductase